MLKKILLIFAVLVVVCYILAVFIVSPGLTRNNVCNSVRVVFKDSLEGFNIMTENQILSFLGNKKIKLKGYKISELNPDTIEKVVMKHPLVKQAECFISPDNEFIIDIFQKRPVLRVMDYKGHNYYIDSDGMVIENIDNFVYYLPILSGNVDPEFIKDKLFGFVAYVENDEFWSSQIEQIHVKDNRDVVIVPRVGENTIMMGPIDDYETKLDKVKTFYQKGLNVVGWNKYKNINVEFEGQVITEKR